jgi:Putative prokaryotic signal transducing protein
MEMVTVARYFNQTAADEASARLEAAGFDILRHSEFSARAEGYPAIVGGIRIQVPADQADDARLLLGSDDDVVAETP